MLGARPHFSLPTSRPIGWSIQTSSSPKPPDKTEKTGLWILLPMTHCSFQARGDRGTISAGDKIYLSLLWAQNRSASHVVSLHLILHLSHYKYCVFAQNMIENLGPGQRGGWLWRKGHWFNGNRPSEAIFRKQRKDKKKLWKGRKCALSSLHFKNTQLPYWASTARKLLILHQHQHFSSERFQKICWMS